jgi:F-type H+-transporting ATPase subunit b
MPAALGVLFSGLPAFAAEGGAEPKMPQLDFSTFSTQIFWLAVSFAILYFLMSRLALPRISESVERRHKRIEGDLDRAAALKAEADTAKAAYEKALADARGRAQATLRDAQGEFTAEASRREAAFSALIGQRTRAAEESIAAAKGKAMAELPAAVADVTESVVARVGGLSLTGAEREQVMAAVKQGRG